MTPRQIIIHHSLTADSGTVSWGAIRRYHVETNGWSDIGYHAGVELVGDHQEILIGRLWDVEGAHVAGHNDDSLGLCLVGNFDEAEPPSNQLDAAAALVRFWMDLYDIPATEVYPHHHFNADKSCPGTKFPWDKFMEKVNA